MQNIIDKNYEPIPDIYSQNFKDIVNILLEKEPSKRPMIVDILGANTYIKEKFKIYQENKKKLEVLCKSDRDQKINNQIFNSNDGINHSKILKGNYSTSNNKSFEIFENNKSDNNNISQNSNITTPIRNINKEMQNINLRKQTNLQENFSNNYSNQNNHFNNFILNSEKSKK